MVLLGTGTEFRVLYRNQLKLQALHLALMGSKTMV